MTLSKLKYTKPFLLDCGEELSNLEIAYHTYGKLNHSKDNVVWICHALTANSDAADWWPGMIGEGCLFDPFDKYIVCANILGSCYGTTGPLSINKITGKAFYRSFPLITMRDIVRVFEILRNHLGITKIHTITGGSIGGQQALEYAIMFPGLIKNLIFIASSAAYSPWGIAFSESQRLAIEADASFFKDGPEGGLKGMRAARTIALLSYRNDQIYNKTQAEDSDEKLDGFKASSYQDYQGNKLVKRFNAYSYYTLTKLSDTHNVGRGRNGKINALQKIKAKTLAIGFSSDLLFPTYEQKFVAENVKDGKYLEIDSLYGHDGFLIETEGITKRIRKFYNNQQNDSTE